MNLCCPQSGSSGATNDDRWCTNLEVITMAKSIASNRKVYPQKRVRELPENDKADIRQQFVDLEKAGNLRNPSGKEHTYSIARASDSSSSKFPGLKPALLPTLLPTHN